jgi:hypothetical protein
MDVTQRNPRGRTRWRLDLAAAATLLGVAVAPAMLEAQVDCSNPNNLCTGDPCTIPAVTVQSPCVADFSPRTLIIGGTLNVPNGGSVSFTAGAIEVRGHIKGKHISPTAGDGADVSLIASGNIEVRKKIDVTGKLSTGQIVLDAGGNILLRAALTSDAGGSGVPSTGGGQVTVTADGSLTSTGRGRVNVAGRQTPGGAMTLSGSTVTIEGRLDVRGSSGGSVAITATSGSLTLNHKIEAEAENTGGTGGSITLNAAGTVLVDRKIDADGRAQGGSININAGTIDMQANVFLKGGVGGTATFSTPGTANLDRIDARSRDTDGGTITVTTGSGDITVGDILNAAGDDGVGGSISLTAGTAAAASINVDRDLRVSSHGNAGTVVLSATGTITVDDKIDADSSQATGGSVQISANGPVVSTDRIEVDGDAGGEIQIASTASGVTLSGRYLAGGLAGGVIEATASGNLTADGDFDAEIGGCIGLAAGGTLNTTGGSFSPPFVASCP